jgi:hypothetical protein
MEGLLRSIVRKFGFKAVYEELEIVRGEYKAFYEEQLAFINEGSKSSATATASANQSADLLPADLQAPSELPATVDLQELVSAADADTVTVADVTNADAKCLQIPEAVAIAADESDKGKEITIEAPKRKMKLIKKGSKTIQVPVKEHHMELEEEEPVPTAPEVPAPVPAPVENTFTASETTALRRTPAEIKKWQREQEAARRIYMKAHKISRTSLMTVENMRNWLGDGQTYAWIAREQLGCKEEDVSKFAKENGLSRKKH